MQKAWLVIGVVAVAASVLAWAAAGPVATRRTGPGVASPAPAGATSAPTTSRPLTGLARAGVFVDAERREIALNGKVVFRLNDIIEYFCCSKGTAEHESIVAVEAEPMAVRLALMLPPFRLQPGRVARWEEDGFKSPSGPTVLVFAEYDDPKTGKTVRVRAEDWIMMAERDPKTGKWPRKPMRPTGFVFAGGSFVTDETDGRQYFLATGDGAIVTVYNRTSSILDNPQREGESDEVWYPNLETVPPLGTKVRVILKPVLPPASGPATRPARP